jgi:hypothetical protein
MKNYALPVGNVSKDVGHLVMDHYISRYAMIDVKIVMNAQSAVIARRRLFAVFRPPRHIFCAAKKAS